MARTSRRQLSSVSIRTLASRADDVAPGVAICLMVAMAASFISSNHGGPTLLYALLLGMVLHFLSGKDDVAPGVQFSTTVVLRSGVALLGTQIGLQEIASLGTTPPLVVLAGVCATIAFGVLVAPALGLTRMLGALTAGAVAICGASAALAIAAVLPQQKHSERDTLFTVVSVTALSTIAMIVYPVLVRMLGYDDVAAGILFGATIHDVAQVVGAGHLVSPVAEATATYVKLLRVALLLPVVFLMAWCFNARLPAQGAEGARTPLLPNFLIVFLVLVVLKSLGAIPKGVAVAMGDISRWCLVTAIAGLGVKTSLESLSKLGAMPLVLVIGETVLLLGLVVTALAVLR